MKTIYYKEGYKYQLDRPYILFTGIPSKGGGNKFVHITTDGLLTISDGYAWDGASGPAIDTKNFMRGSLVHDALYQLISMGIVDGEYKTAADDLLYEIVREDGMWPTRAWWVHKAVLWFGKVSFNPISNNTLSAP